MQIETRWIEDAAVTSAKIDGSVATSASVTTEASRALAAEALLTPLANSGVALGYCPLDAGVKIPLIYLPTGAEVYLGTWDASANTPTLSNSTAPASGRNYRVSVAGSVDFGAGSIPFLVGDEVISNGTIWQKIGSSNTVASVNGLLGVVVLTTTNIAEGTNLYYTDGRAQTAAVVNSTAGTQTVQAPSVAATKLAIAAEATARDAAISVAVAAALATAGQCKREYITLSSGDITNQYRDLLNTILLDSNIISIAGVSQYEGSDYSLSTVAGKTRITFINGLATGGASSLIAGDVLRVNYRY